MVFIAAGFSVLFWINASKIGDVFQPDNGLVAVNDRSQIAPEGASENTATTTSNARTQNAKTDAQKLSPSKPKVSDPPVAATTTAPVSPVRQLINKIETILPGNAALSRAGVVAQTNKQRLAYLGAGHDLKENSRLDLAAQNKINDMFSGQYFEHTSPQGLDAGDLATAAKYEYIAVGENLAMGDYKNDAALMEAWMNSSGHRENILRDDYKEIGAAVGYGTFNGRKTWLAVRKPIQLCRRGSTARKMFWTDSPQTKQLYRRGLTRKRRPRKHSKTNWKI